MVGDLLAEFLSLDGHQVDRAANGREALDLVRRREYALIVSDVDDSTERTVVPAGIAPPKSIRGTPVIAFVNSAEAAVSVGLPWVKTPSLISLKVPATTSPG